MPRGKRDLFSTMRRQAERVLAALGREIRKREGELQKLLAEANVWRHAIGGRLMPSRRGPSAPRGRRRATVAKTAARRGARGASGRVNWAEVLAAVPEKFGVAEVMKHPGARAKGRAQVYPALSRWVDGKRIKKIGKGRYQKV
jgi:hypothetical protein